MSSSQATLRSIERPLRHQPAAPTNLDKDTHDQPIQTLISSRSPNTFAPSSSPPRLPFTLGTQQTPQPTTIAAFITPTIPSTSRSSHSHFLTLLPHHIPTYPSPLPLPSVTLSASTIQPSVHNTHTHSVYPAQIFAYYTLQTCSQHHNTTFTTSHRTTQHSHNITFTQHHITTQHSNKHTTSKQAHNTTPHNKTTKQQSSHPQHTTKQQNNKPPTLSTNKLSLSLSLQPPMALFSGAVLDSYDDIHTFIYMYVYMYVNHECEHEHA